jgi:DNA-binding NarL/FixJ family response regulator
MGTLEEAQAELARRQAQPSVMDMVRQELARRIAPQQQGVPQGATLLGTFADNGRVFQMPDGSLQAVSAGGATADPATVRRIMEGGTFAAAMQDRLDQERIDQNPIASRANEVIRGVPFVGSYTDEAVGLVSPQAAENMRLSTAAMQRQNPGQTAALNITGGVLGAIPMALAAAPGLSALAPAGRAMRAVAGAATGALTGATEGAIWGAGEGTTAQERTDNARQNAGFGAIGGAVLGAVAPVAGDLLRAGWQRLARSDVATIASQLNVSRAAATVIRDALQTGDIQAAQAALQRAGDDAMLADAGIPARQLLDAAAQTGGPAGQVVRQAVDQRVTTASRDMTGALDRTLGAPRGEQALIQELRQQSAQPRSQAYDLAYSTPINYAAPEGQALENLLRRVPRQAISRAEEIMRLRGEQSAQILIEELPNGQFRFQRLPDVRQTHYIMQALDDIAKGTDGSGTFGRQNTYGASIENLRGQISQNLRAVVPEFGAAQDIAADTARQLSATDLGRNLFNMPREDVARALSGATQAERRAAEQGLRSYIDDVTARITRTLTDGNMEAREGIRVLRDFSSRQNQTNLRILLGQERADALLEELDRAATAFELRAAVAENSKTAARQAIQGAVQERTEGLLSTLMAGEPVNATKRLVQALTGETAEAVELRRMGLYEEIARALTESRGDRARTALRMVQLAMNGQQISNRQAELIATALSAGSVLQGRPAAQLTLQAQ